MLGKCERQLKAAKRSGKAAKVKPLKKRIQSMVAILGESLIRDCLRGALPNLAELHSGARDVDDGGIALIDGTE